MLLNSIRSYEGRRYHQHTGRAFTTVTHLAVRLLDKEGTTDYEYFCDTEQEQWSATQAEGMPLAIGQHGGRESR
jgi:hypothetical protein